MAFGNHKQYEELLVYDNQPVFDIFEERYQSIYEQPSDFIPDRLKGNRKLIHNPNMLVNLIFDEVEGEKSSFSIPKDEMDLFKNHQVKEGARQTEDIIIHEVIQLITKENKKTETYDLLKPSQLAKRRKN